MHRKWQRPNKVTQRKRVKRPILAGKTTPLPKGEQGSELRNHSRREFNTVISNCSTVPGSFRAWLLQGCPAGWLVSQLASRASPGPPGAEPAFTQSTGDSCPIAPERQRARLSRVCHSCYPRFLLELLSFSSRPLVCVLTLRDARNTHVDNSTKPKHPAL